MSAAPQPINLRDKLRLIPESWMPHLLATIDGVGVKLVRIAGPFVWHSHQDAHELFLVIEGSFRMEFRSHQVTVAQGEMILVPQGVEHRPVADEECAVLLIERADVVNTGDALAGPLTRAMLPAL